MLERDDEFRFTREVLGGEIDGTRLEFRRTAATYLLADRLMGVINEMGSQYWNSIAVNPGEAVRPWIDPKTGEKKVIEVTGRIVRGRLGPYIQGARIIVQGEEALCVVSDDDHIHPRCYDGTVPGSLKKISRAIEMLSAFEETPHSQPQPPTQ